MLIGLLLLLLFLASPVSAAQKDVSLERIRFVPDAVTIAPGDSIKWTHNDENTPHTITAKNGSFDSHPECKTFQDSVVPGWCMKSDSPPYVRTFNDVGTVEYFCRIHGGMTGTITVLSPTPPPAATSPPGPTASPSLAVSSAPTASPEPSPTASPGDPPALPPSASPTPEQTPLIEAEDKRESSPVTIIGAIGFLLAGGAGVGLWYLRSRT